MNKNDAKVYKALAEAGFDLGHDIPDPDLDDIVKIVTSEDDMFLEKLSELFDVDRETIRERINDLLK